MSFIAKNGRRFHWNGERAETGPDLPQRLGYSHTNAVHSYRLEPGDEGWTMTPVPDGPCHVRSLDEAADIMDRIEEAERGARD